MYFNNNHAQGEELFIENSDENLTTTNNLPLILDPKLTSQPTQSTNPSNFPTPQSNPKYPTKRNQ